MMPVMKNCEICENNSTCLCYKCMSYYCESCFKLAHNNEKKKMHTKEKIDYYLPITLKCPNHNLNVIDLFCTDEKGNKFKFNLFIY